MPTYTVHAPPRQGAMDPERLVFLRDGFHGWAFIAPALWLLVYRQWLGLLIYVLTTSAIVAGLVWLGAGTAAIVAAAFCISLLIGFEAASIRRWSFARRGWAMLGLVVGEDRDIAEHRFLSQWADRSEAVEDTAAASSPEWNVPFRRREPGVIGLFPQPDRAR